MRSILKIWLATCLTLTAMSPPSVLATETDAKAEANGGKGEAGPSPSGSEHGKEAMPGDELPIPGPVPLWPANPAVETARQPYVLVRTLRSVQDQVAKGSREAHQFQGQYLRDLGNQFLALPPEVWDDVRNVRAAAYFVLSGGDPKVLHVVTNRKTPGFIDRRLLRGALAYGEGRAVDARALLEEIDARSLDPALGGMLALVQGTLFAKIDIKKAIAYFDDARLLSPGTLVEESALRQEILLLAKDGNTEKFDVLSAQYSRRFAKSLYAANFRRQFISGFAGHSFKGMNEWISRTEAELMKVPEDERLGMYLAIAEEATKGGHGEIAKFAATKARALAAPGTREHSRASLYGGAMLVISDDYDRGIALLAEVQEDILGSSDREIYDATVRVARNIRRWPEAPAEISDPLPASILRAQQLISQVDNLLSGGRQ